MKNRLLFVSFILAFITLQSCRFEKYPEIETNIKVSNYLRKTYDASVCVWVNTPDGFAYSLEYYEKIYDVPKGVADSFVREKLKEAEIVKLQIDSFLITEQKNK